MFRCPPDKDGQVNLIKIIGSFAHSTSNDISGISLQNTDGDTKITYDLAEICVRDAFGNITENGYGDFLIKTKAGMSNPMTEALRIKYNQYVGIGTTLPEEKLSISDGNILVTGSNNVGFITKNSNVSLGLFNYGSNQGLFYNSNLTIGKYSGDILNPSLITSNIVIKNNGDIDIYGLTTFNSNVIIKGQVTFDNFNLTNIEDIDSDLTVTGDIDIYKSLNVKSNISFNKNLSFYTNSNTLLSIDNNSNLHTYNPLLNRGDLLIHTGVTETRLPIGSYNQILISDSNETNGLNWKNLSNDIYNLNPNKTKIINCINQDILTLTTEYQDITYDNINITANDFYTIINNKEIQILKSDKYFITFSTNCEINNDISSIDYTEISTRFLIDNGSGYIELDASQCHSINYTEDMNITNLSLTFIIYLNANTKLKTQIKNSNSYIILNTIADNTYININRIKLDNELDNSQYLSLYKTSNQSINPIYTDIIWNTCRYIDNNYTLNNTDITLITEGKYIIICNIGFIKSSGVDKSSVQIRLLNNNVEIDGSISVAFINDNTTKNVTYTYFIQNFSANSIIKVQAKTIYGLNLQINQYSTNFNIIKFSSSLNNQNIPRYFSGFTNMELVIPNYYIDLPINIEVIKDDIYTHSVDDSVINLLESGYYMIFVNISLKNYTNNNNYYRVKLMYNTNDIGYEKCFMNLSGDFLLNDSNNSISTSSLNLISYFQNNTKLKLQIININNYSLKNISNSSTLSIIKVDDLNTDNFLLKSFYQENTSFEETYSNSSEFINKVVLNTEYLLNGNYNIFIAYEIIPQTTYDNLTIQLLLNGIVIYSNIISNLTNIQFYNYNLFKYFDENHHQLQLQFKTNNSNTIVICNSKISIYRIN
jgi:hypothetical protein